MRGPRAVYDRGIGRKETHVGAACQGTCAALSRVGAGGREGGRDSAGGREGANHDCGWLLACVPIQMLGYLFNAGDTNGDGVLDIDEFTAIVRYVDPTTKSAKVLTVVRIVLH